MNTPDHLRSVLAAFGRHRWSFPDLSWATAHVDLALRHAVSRTGLPDDQSPDQGFLQVRPPAHRTIVVPAKPIDPAPSGGLQT